MRKLVGVELVDEFPIYDITVEEDHCFELFNGIIAHNSMHSSQVVGGGTGIYFGADNIYIVGRRQEKEGTELTGYNFILNAEKSRFIKEKSAIPIEVSFEGGINKYSGLIEIALELGYVTKPKNGWYARVNVETGEVEDKNYRLSQTDNAEFWDDILSNPTFIAAVEEKYQYNKNLINSDEEESEIVDQIYNDEESDDTEV